MEELSFLFNADFDEKIWTGQNYIESSKVNQEFEYLIHWINPNLKIYSSKSYTKDYLNYLAAQTDSNPKFSLKGPTAFYCQDYEKLDLKKRLQSKFNLFEYLKKKELIFHSAEIITEESDIEAGFLYKSSYGVSGSGHFLIPRDFKKALEHLVRAKKLLKEELLVRDMDFSTLVENGEIISQYENIIDERFQYKGSVFKPNFNLGRSLDQKYQEILKAVLEYTKDYRGVFSIDGFRFGSHSKIHGACELNIRKTMGYMAFKLWKNYYSDQDFFKLLLFRNRFPSKDLLNFFLVDKRAKLKLLSPVGNRFSLFMLAGECEKEIRELELELYSTLFKS